MENARALLNRGRQSHSRNPSTTGPPPSPPSKDESNASIESLPGLLLLNHALQEQDYSYFPQSIQLLTETSLDPRIILTAFPFTGQDIFWGENSDIRLSDEGQLALTRTLELVNTVDFADESAEVTSAVLNGFLRPFLIAWRGKRNDSSIPDIGNINKSVDLILLRLLVRLDTSTSLKPPTGPSPFSPRSSSLPAAPEPAGRAARTDLYHLVDQRISVLSEGVELLETSKRLFVLSRLYQAHKQYRLVVATWVRIIEGETDSGGDEFQIATGEDRVFQYLLKLRDVSIVRDYGVWLAKRDPGLGVQLFCSDKSRVKIPVDEVLGLLKEQAPGAVRGFLEYLVFEQDRTEFSGQLLGFYLDSVLGTLAESKVAKTQLQLTYEAYRALGQPRGSYTQFITENALGEEWWQHRLRLLQILGGTGGSSLLTAGRGELLRDVQQRILKYEDLLVPEAIILDGLNGLHEKALRHLVEGLGDYDTAVQYCLQSGSAIFYPSAGTIGQSQDSGSTTSTQPKILLGSLFNILLQLEDPTLRREQTVHLLASYPEYFNPLPTLKRLPPTWTVGQLEPYLLGALRLLTAQQVEAAVLKALLGVKALNVSGELVEKMEEMGPQFELPKDSGVSFS